MSPEQVIFAFFAVGFIVLGYLNIIFFVCKGQLIFSVDQEKKSCRILWPWNFKGVAQGSPDLSRNFKGKIAKLKFFVFLSMPPGFLFRFCAVANQSLKN